MDPSHKLIARIAGVILLLFGFVWAAPAASLAVNQFVIDRSIDVGVNVILVVLALSAVFFLSIGFRLAFNRPNKYGSMLPPAGWYALATVFALAGAIFAVITAKKRDYKALTGLFTFAFLFWWCALAARTVRSRVEGKTVIVQDPFLPEAG